MKFFEDQKYEEWKLYVEQCLPSLLKRNLLIKPHHAAEEMRAAAQKEADEAGNVTIDTAYENALNCQTKIEN